MTRATAGFREGLYTPERTDELYTELLHRAQQLLERGESVILDASWTSQAHRDRAQGLARDTDSHLLQMECRTTAEAARQRILCRPRTPSDATLPVASAIAIDADPWPEAVPIPTSGPLRESLDLAAAVWRGGDAIMG